ncbi:MAG: alpha/beta hydrolase [Dehalococcoidales bacterium]|nr:alpha/beta hydrolase [Dehalococcoidales bacterium]
MSGKSEAKGSRTYKGTTMNIPYAVIPDVEQNLLSLDIYVPETGEDLPVMVWFHGGAWRMGDKQPPDFKAEAFNKHGWIYVSANYRLSPQASFPAHAEDLASAIAWVKQNISQYRGNPDNVFIGGHSSGAHLVALVGMDEHYLGKHGMRLKDLKGVIVLDTQIFDIKSLVRYTDGRLAPVYTAVFGETEEAWKTASPAAFVTSGKNIPPMLVAHTPTGGISRIEENTRFVQLLNGAGVKAVLVPTEKTHLAINYELGKPGDWVTEKAFSFLGRCLAS